MQKFIRIMAIIAAALVASSLVFMLVSIPFQRVIGGRILGSPEEILGYLPKFPVLPFVNCLLTLGVIALLIICCGNKKGGFWLELIVFACLALVLPGISRLSSLISTAWMGRMGTAYLAANSAVSRIAEFCMIPAGWGSALAYAACGMSVVFKKMTKCKNSET